MSATKKGPGRCCAVCGESITAHTLRIVSAHERVLIIRRARTRSEANAQIRAAQRVCPLVAVATPDGQPQRYQPARLQSNVTSMPKRSGRRTPARKAA